MVPVQAINSANLVKSVSDGCKEVLDSCLIQISDLRKIENNLQSQVKVQERIIEDVTTKANEVVERNTELLKQNQKLRRTAKVLTGTSLLLLVMVLL